MTISILGTGTVGQTLAESLAAKGLSVMLGTRNVSATLAKAGNDQLGSPSFVDWQATNRTVQLGTFAQAAVFGEVIINATPGIGTLAVLGEAGEENLAGKILIDIANSLDFSRGTSGPLFIANDDSLGETIQRRFPATRVVKTLNTVPAAIMVNPALIAGEHNVFISGNDEAAKATVCSLLTDQFGWKATGILDLGDITTARATEQLLPIGLQLWKLLKTNLFNYSIVR